MARMGCSRLLTIGVTISLTLSRTAPHGTGLYGGLAPTTTISMFSVSLYRSETLNEPLVALQDMRKELFDRAYQLYWGWVSWPSFGANEAARNTLQGSLED